MSKVYLVTEGSYSSYHVKAVFSTRELAEEFIREQDAYSHHWGDKPMEFGNSDCIIEEFDLDAPIPPRVGGAFVATVYDDGVATSSWDEDESPDSPATKEPAPTYMNGRKWAFTGYGSTREHARRSAEELRRVTLTEPAALHS